MVLHICFEVTQFGEVGEILPRRVAQRFLELIQVGLECCRHQRGLVLEVSGFWHGEILAVVGRIC